LGGTQRAAGTDVTTVLAGLLMMLTWGSSSVAYKLALPAYGPGQLTLLRFLITASVMILYAALTRMRLPVRRDVLPLLGLGVIGISTNQLAFSFGITTVDPGTATFLVAATPVMAAVLARFFLAERLSPAGWLGIALTVIGTTVLVFGRGQGIAYTQGALLLLAGALFEAGYFIMQKPFLRRYTSLEVSTWSLIAAVLPMLIFLPGLGDQLRGAPPIATGAIAYAAIGAGVIGYFCMSVANSRLPASVAAVLMAGMPPVALIAARIVLGIVPPLLSVLGGAVSVAGVLLVTLRGHAAPGEAEIVPALTVPVID
jgi:drug/metabolite transporter (DMT)-like permease